MTETVLQDGMVAVPCAVQMDPAHPQRGWLFIPHVDGQWVSAARLDVFSRKIIEYWLAAQDAPKATPQAAPAEPPRLHLAAMAVLRHWDEFGPEHGLDETMDGLRRVLARAIEAEVRSAQLATDPSSSAASSIKPE